MGKVISWDLVRSGQRQPRSARLVQIGTLGTYSVGIQEGIDMGFLDKAKAAANDLAAKADTAMASSGMGGPGGATGGQPDKLFRDLGVLAYLDATGRQAPDGERERIIGTLREAEQRGGIPSFALQTAAPPPGSVPP